MIYNTKGAKRIALCFLLPSFILLFLFTYLPAIQMVRYSFTDWDGLTTTANFVGFDNYKQAFSNPEYFKPILISGYYLIASFIQIGLAIGLATLLSYNLKFTNFFKGIYFFPVLINSVAVSFMFLLYFQPGGVLDTTLATIGIENTSLWLGDPAVVNISLAYASVWRYIGLNIVMFTAAIQSINKDLFEAAQIDGANKWHEFKYIILPGVKRVIGINLFLAVTGALTVFEMPFIMLNGGNGSETFVIQNLNLAFDAKAAGFACALSVCLIIIIIIIVTIQNKVGGGLQDEK